jgi:sugar lactone lactonase YvrE
MRYQPKLLAEGFLFPEAPRWHARRGAFYVSDIDRGQILEVPLAGPRRLVYQAPGWVSGFAFADVETLVVTHAQERRLVAVRLDRPGAAPEPVASLEAIAPFAINDLIRAPSGHVFVDTVAFDFVAYARGEASPGPSPLACVAPDGTASIASREVTFPNGMAIPPSGDRLLVADSLDPCVHAFPLRPDGSLGPRSVFARLPGEMPDGVSLDASGALWVASHHRVLRVAEGGEVLDEVDMGATRATACMLGGPEGRTLLVTASDSHDRAVIAKNPSGRLFTARVEVPGAGLPSIYERS